MNRSTILSATLAPAAVLLAITVAPAQADTGTGPLASLTNGPLRSATGQNLLTTATLAHPQAALPGNPVTSADGTVRLDRGTASVSGHRVAVDLGKGQVSTGSKGQVKGVAFTRVTARCVTTAAGGVQAGTTIDGGRLVGHSISMPKLPAHPPVDYRVPLNDPHTAIVLNKQVTDPTGAVTVTAMSVREAAGGTRDLGIARCLPAAAPAAVPQRAAAPQPPASGPMLPVNPQQLLQGTITKLVAPVQNLEPRSVPVAGAVPARQPQAARVASTPADGAPGAPAAPGADPVLTSVSALLGGLPGLPTKLPVGG